MTDKSLMASKWISSEIVVKCRCGLFPLIPTSCSQATSLHHLLIFLKNVSYGSHAVCYLKYLFLLDIQLKFKVALCSAITFMRLLPII